MANKSRAIITRTAMHRALSSARPAQLNRLPNSSNIHTTTSSRSSSAKAPPPISSSSSSSSSSSLVPSTKVVYGGRDPRKRPRWTESEDRRLDQLLIPYLAKPSGRPRLVSAVDWESIARGFGGTKSITSLKARFVIRRAEINHARDHRTTTGTEAGADGKMRAGRWSAEEDDALKMAVVLYEEKNWDMVARFVGARNPYQCLSRWRYLAVPFGAGKMPQEYWKNILVQRSRLGNDGGRPDGAAGREKNSLLSVLKEVLESDKSGRGAAGSRDAAAAAAAAAALDGRKDIDIDPVKARRFGGTFSAEEDNMIFRLVRLYGNEWVRITRLINAARRSGQVGPLHSADAGAADPQIREWKPLEIYQRHRRLLSEYVRSGERRPRSPTTTLRRRRVPWTKEEDAQLVCLVEKHMARTDQHASWSKIASLMPTTAANRTAIQCCTRWTQHIGSHLDRSPFRLEEDQKMWPFVVDGFNKLVAENNGSTSGRVGIRSERIRNLMLHELYSFMKDADTKMKLRGAKAEASSMRSLVLLTSRVRRLLRVMNWLYVDCKVRDPCANCELVSRLANVPINFYVGHDKPE
ncbi:hypothetical protein H4217_006926 [Coemansia sp. RSA 1939]|nr:hypothetical protein H4217_006926 [Coemansia sp. RSA 1939]KAJ2602339.1 hypothetical protein EV177_006833 [Coemansia sp. RSA 1804]